LLDWCAGLLGGEPLNVSARRLEPSGFSTLFLEFAGGRGVQITHRHGVADRPAIRLEVLAERGSALVKLPYQVSWATREGFHSHALRGHGSLARVLLEHFREVIQGRAALEPTLADAYRVLRWLRLAARSREEGRLLTVTA
jgi:predicted dehydrogenase